MKVDPPLVVETDATVKQSGGRMDRKLCSVIHPATFSNSINHQNVSLKVRAGTIQRVMYILHTASLLIYYDRLQTAV